MISESGVAFDDQSVTAMPRSTRKRKSVLQAPENAAGASNAAPPKQPRVTIATDDDGLVTHPEVSCDVSDMYPLRGTRWHKIDEDFDLCQAEFDKLSETEKCKYERIEIPGATPIAYSANSKRQGKSGLAAGKSSNDSSATRIKVLEKNACLGPKHANDIIELLELCEAFRSTVEGSEAEQSESVNTSYKAIHALHRVQNTINVYMGAKRDIEQ